MVLTAIKHWLAGPPTQRPVVTVIGDFDHPTYPFSGDLQKGAADGAWTRATQNAWLGVEWETPWAPNSLEVFASIDDGFLLGDGGELSVALFGANTKPAHSTDGVGLGAAYEIVDTMGARVSWGRKLIGSVPYRYHWVTLTKAGNPTSLYISRIVFR